MEEEKNIPGNKHKNEILPENDENILQETSTGNDGPAAEAPEILNTIDPHKKANAGQELLQSPKEEKEAQHHSKKWKDYLFEFLMLFLAVTAGFFVDNKREYYIEHERAKQFSRQLLADLRSDSLLFENRNRDIRNMQKGFDALLYLLTVKAQATDKEILEVLLPVTYVFDIPATSTTYGQMKSSGSLRYIENFDLTAHLQDYYDVLLPRSIKISEAALDYYTEKIDPFYIKHIRIQDYDPFNDSLINKSPVIMERSTRTDQELANIMGHYSALLKIQVITMNDPALKKIRETIRILKGEYHLE